MFFYKFLRFLCFLFAFINASACNMSGQQANLPPHKVEDNGLPTQRQLFMAFRNQPKITLVYGTQNEAFELNYKDLAEKIKYSSSTRYDVKIKKDTDLTAGELKGEILYLIGHPNSNTIIRQLLPKLPFSTSENGFKFGAEDFHSPSNLLFLSFYPNPENHFLPISLATGNSDEAILQELEKKLTQGYRGLLRTRWGYEVFEAGRKIILGSFSDKTWLLDKKLHFTFRFIDTLFQTSHFNFIGHNFSKAQLDFEAFGEKMEKKFQAILAFTKRKSENQPNKINYHIYPTAEEKGLIINNTEQANVDLDENEVHTVINEQFKNNFIEKENELLVRQLLGKPKTLALEKGLAVCFTKQWQVKGYEYWGARLYESNNIPSINDLITNAYFEQSSKLIMGSMAGVFVDFLIAEFGLSDFLKKYPNWTFRDSDINKMKDKWEQYLHQLTLKYPKETVLTNNNISFLKGFNFAHEGYAIYNGYISRKATESLERLKSIGTNAISIIPYSYMRDPNKPTRLPLMHDPGSENDESVIHSAFEAKKLGMTTMLKPQIWLGRSWPGDIEMQNEKDWQQFFQNYHHWILHYAMLAEIHQMDILCLGVEFQKATLQRENDWRRLIKKIKSFYSGPLTYCANWGTEFEKVGFWDELDFIGLSCYYPISYADNPDKNDLRRGFRKILTKIKKVKEKYNKPLLITEIGFRSVDAPWKNPHADSDQQVENETHQKRCYEIVADELKKADWINGIFWWKWSCDLDYHRPGKFTPQDKEAEAVVKDWFLKGK